MAKSLGQIHTVNHTMTFANAGAINNIDVSGELTAQLERNIRQGNYFKVVGIDMSLSTQGTVGGGQVTGYLRYYAPTAGRCEAYRSAFKAMKKVMDVQGISMNDRSGNSMYDFRAQITDENGGIAMKNQATLDGTAGLALYHQTDAKASIFGVHNESVFPRVSVAGTADVSTGFDTIINEGTSATDFILNNQRLYTGNSDTANVNWEYIPFTLTWTPDTTDLVTVWQWRPDPALFLAVMTGQFQIYVEEVNLDGTASALELNVAVMVSGWKSIMGNPATVKMPRKFGKTTRGRRK
jgi:hypothetical protein